MKRRILFLFISWLIMSQTHAGEWIPVTSKVVSPAKVSLISGNPSQSVVKFSVSGFERTLVNTPQGSAYKISVPGGTYLLEAGSPDLPKLTASLMIPAQDEMEVRILSSKYMDFNNINISPSKGNLTRDIDPSTVPYSYGKPYVQAGFFPGHLSSLREPYILRDIRGQALLAYPFQYDASSKTLRVYYEIIVEVYSTGNTGYNTLPSTASGHVSQEFHHIYDRHFLNYHQVKYTPLEDYGKMLVISHGPYMSAMQPFIEWKNMSGIPTEIVDVATIGSTAAAIKAYVSNYYTTHDLTFLLLVGDAMHIPTITASSGHSDNSYGYLVGNDSYPEVFVGRFSAESVTDVETQVMRSIDYERNPSPYSGHFNRGIGIASDEGPGDDNEMDYQHVRNMLNDLLGYTYDYAAELYEGSQGGNDQSGNPTSAMVTSELNTGSGVILYTGHGSTTSWSTTSFSNSNINALENTAMLPFIWSVACVNGNFVNNTCFAETWLRARNGDVPAGAVATLMSTINQSWDPPMKGQDEMVDIMVESYAANIKRTFGGLSMNGCMKMNDVYGSAGTSMTDTWNLFGDPSLMVRTDTPQLFTATHLPTLLLGTSQLSLTTSFLDEGRATLSHNGQILSSLPFSAGVVNLTFNPLLALDTLHLVITSYNKIPYIAQIPVIPASGPYIIYCQHQVDDVQGNQNGLPDYGESILLNLSLQNLGIDQANVVNANLQTSDPHITIDIGSNTWGNIPAGDTSMLQAAFEVSIASDAPDQHQVLFNLNVTDTSSNAWTSSFIMKINAPSLSLGNLILDDMVGGNGNGLVDPGETIVISVPAINSGHSQSAAANLLFASASPHVTIDTTWLLMPGIPASSQHTGVFVIHVDSNIALGSSIDLHAFLQAGSYQAQKTFYLPVGIFSEDFETGDFSKFPWTFGGSASWILESANPYQGNFSARSGVIPNNAATEMTVSMNVLINDSISFYRKVSSESSYDFLEFYIDNTKVDEWSGEVAWGKKAYPVTAGNRTFKWRYVKDFYMTGGSDRAWVDEIVFPPIAMGAVPFNINVLATPSTICEGESTQLYTVVSVPGGTLSYTWYPATGLDDATSANPKATPGSTTTYHVTVTNGTDTAFSSATVDVQPRPVTPVVSVLGPDLFSSSTSGNQWYDSLGLISGATAQVYTPQASGQFYVEVMGSNGCVSLPSNMITFTWTGQEEKEKTPALHLYPNPTTNHVVIGYSLQNPSHVSISLMDVLGNTVKKLYDGDDPSGYSSHRLSLDGISSGLYLLNVNSEAWQGLKKLIIR